MTVLSGAAVEPLDPNATIPEPLGASLDRLVGRCDPSLSLPAV